MQSKFDQLFAIESNVLKALLILAPPFFLLGAYSLNTGVFPSLNSKTMGGFALMYLLCLPFTSLFLPLVLTIPFAISAVTHETISRKNAKKKHLASIVTNPQKLKEFRQIIVLSIFYGWIALLPFCLLHYSTIYRGSFSRAFFDFLASGLILFAAILFLWYLVDNKKAKNISTIFTVLIVSILIAFVHNWLSKVFPLIEIPIYRLSIMGIVFASILIKMTGERARINKFVVAMGIIILIFIVISIWGYVTKQPKLPISWDIPLLFFVCIAFIYIQRQIYSWYGIESSSHLYYCIPPIWQISLIGIILLHAYIENAPPSLLEFLIQPKVTPLSLSLIGFLFLLSSFFSTQAYFQFLMRVEDVKRDFSSHFFKLCLAINVFCFLTFFVSFLPVSSNPVVAVGDFTLSHLNIGGNKPVTLYVENFLMEHDNDHPPLLKIKAKLMWEMGEEWKVKVNSITDVNGCEVAQKDDLIGKKIILHESQIKLSIANPL